MPTRATETRRRNKRNAHIVAFLEALPVGSHGLYVTKWFEAQIKPEGGMSFDADHTKITIAPARKTEE